MFTSVFHLITHFLSVLSAMVWQVYWPLAFGLMLSSILRNCLPIDTVIHHLGKTSVKSLIITTILGMVSSSCSYAAASLSRTLISKKASLGNAMAFLVASTNLILEMFIVLVSLLGWQFLWGEVTGGIILIIITACLFSLYPKAQENALRQKLSNENMSQHISMNMNTDPNKKTHNKIINKICHSAGFFQMDIAMIGKEIMIGVLISSLLIAVIPNNWWQHIFIEQHTSMPFWLHSFLDVLIGILVAIIAYVCSVGNLLLAAALWHGGISFGGVMGFILADVLTIPMAHVYKKYYGASPARWMVALLFFAILMTGLIVNLIFSGMNWQLSQQTIREFHQAGFGLNTTTLMNIIFIPLSICYYFLGKKSNKSMSMGMQM